MCIKELEIDPIKSPLRASLDQLLRDQFKEMRESAIKANVNSEDPLLERIAAHKARFEQIETYAKIQAQIDIENAYNSLAELEAQLEECRKAKSL